MTKFWTNELMKSTIFGFQNKLIMKKISPNPFDLLLTFFHFSDDVQITRDPDRLSKIRTVLDPICKNFQSALKSDQEVAIDESMVPRRGRLVFRQWLPANSIKGYKLCTPGSYTYNFSIYWSRNDNDSSKGNTFDVAMKLMEGLLNIGHILYFDNYYTSVKLAKHDLQTDTYICGTLCTNRNGNPKEEC